MNSEHVWGCDWAVWCEWNLQISPHFIQDSTVKTDLRWKKSEIISPHGSLLRKKRCLVVLDGRKKPCIVEILFSLCVFSCRGGGPARSYDTAGIQAEQHAEPHQNVWWCRRGRVEAG